MVFGLKEFSKLISLHFSTVLLPSLFIFLSAFSFSLHTSILSFPVDTRYLPNLQVALSSLIFIAFYLPYLHLALSHLHLHPPSLPALRPATATYRATALSLKPRTAYDATEHSALYTRIEAYAQESAAARATRGDAQLRPRERARERGRATTSRARERERLTTSSLTQRTQEAR